MLQIKDKKIDQSKYSDNEKLKELDREYAEHYVKQAPNDLAILAAALKAKDVSKIQFQAHKMIPTMALLENEKAASMLKMLSSHDTSESDVLMMTTFVIKEIESSLSDIN